MSVNNYIKIIDNIFKSGKLVHCYLLNYFSKSSNDDALLYFLNKIDENDYKSVNKESFSQNIYLIDSEEKIIKKEDILQVFKDASSTIVGNKKNRIIIIKNVENASVNGINSILKIIEDPIENTIILMTTDSISQVLSTIKSRSQIINIFSDTKKEIFDNLSLDGKYKTLSLVLSNITLELYFARSFYNVDFNKYLYKIAEKVQKSWKNKYILYNFLSENIVSENYKRNYFTLYSLTYFYKLLASTDLNTLEKKLKIKLLSSNKKIDENFIDLSGFIFDVNNFFSNTNNRGLNFMLQKERLLIKLMEIYG